MILRQNIGSTDGLGQSLPPVGFEALLVARSVTAASTPTTFNDSDVLQTAGVTAWNEAQIVATVPLTTEVSFESLRPSAEVDSSGYVTRLTNGAAKIRCSANGVASIVQFDVTLTGGQVISEFVDYTDGTVSELIATPGMAAMAPGTTLPYFSAFDVVANTFTKSTTCWAKDFLPSMAVSTDIFGVWTTANRGALITTRHHAGAHHWDVTSPTAGKGYVIGTKIRYRGASGTIYERTVIGVAYWADLVIATLDSVLPADVTPLPIVGEWIVNSRANSGSSASYYSGGIGFFVDQNLQCKAMVLGNPLAASLTGIEDATVNGTLHSNAIPLFSVGVNSYITADFLTGKTGFFGSGVTGDSGSAVMVIANEAPALMFTFYGPVVGTPLFNSGGALVNSLIAAADTNAVISTGYTVTVAADPTL